MAVTAIANAPVLVQVSLCEDTWAQKYKGIAGSEQVYRILLLLPVTFNSTGDVY